MDTSESIYLKSIDRSIDRPIVCFFEIESSRVESVEMKMEKLKVQVFY